MRTPGRWLLALVLVFAGLGSAGAADERPRPLPGARAGAPSEEG